MKKKLHLIGSDTINGRKVRAVLAIETEADWLAMDKDDIGLMRNFHPTDITEVAIDSHLNYARFILKTTGRWISMLVGAEGIEPPNTAFKAQGLGHSATPQEMVPPAGADPASTA